MRKLTTEEFISRSNSVHGNKYDYSKSIYSGVKEKLIIICKEHDVEFTQEPSNHMQGKTGCVKCEPKIKRYPVINGMKECSKCRDIKKINDFHRNSSKCKICAISDANYYYELKATSNKTIMVKLEDRASLAKARVSGVKHYKSKLPCKNGHIGKRLVSTQQCCKCLQDRKRKQRNDDVALKRKAAMIKSATAKNLGINHYTTGEPCKHGHLSPRLVSTRQCVECLKLRKSDRSTKKSAEARRRTNAKRRKPAARAKQRKYQSEVLFGRADYRMRVFMRSCLTRLMVFKDGNRTAKLLGYSRFDLMKRIEFNFRDGMSWDNYGEWHIDHKKPLARFIAQGITDPKIVNALSNLQPLWAKDNISKGDKF